MQNSSLRTLPGLVPSALPAFATPPATAFLNALASSPPAPLRPLVAPPASTAAAFPWQWYFVTRRFDQIIEAIGIRQDEVDDGLKKLGRVVASLNRCYWNGSSETTNALLLGSWAKQTRVRPFSDIDVLFVLPVDVCWRFETRAGNKQSQLLQELRANLRVTYPRTDIRGDGQVVVVAVDGVTIEIVPAILLTDGRYWICDTNNDGRYKLADPAAELQVLETTNALYSGNPRQLTRLLKKWQIENQVSIKAFQLERLALDFLKGWPHNTRDRFWYDFMMRDFFLYMIGRANGLVQMPGTGEWISLGDGWLGAAKRAYRSALLACAYEQANLEVRAGESWQEIFGSAAQVRMF